jgi:hypothetical protein
MEARRFKEGADVSKRLGKLGIGAAIDGGGARSRGNQTEQHPQGRRLSGAVRPEKTGDRAFPRRKGEIVNYGNVAETFGQALNLDR